MLQFWSHFWSEIEGILTKNDSTFLPHIWRIFGGFFFDGFFSTKKSRFFSIKNIFDEKNRRIFFRPTIFFHHHPTKKISVEKNHRKTNNIFREKKWTISEISKKNDFPKIFLVFFYLKIYFSRSICFDFFFGFCVVEISIFRIFFFGKKFSVFRWKKCSIKIFLI